MTIGLLLCDHVAEALRPIAGDYDAMFRNWLGPPFPDATWRIYDLAAGQYPTDLAECDFYITTGSKASVYDDEPWIHAFAGLVRDIDQARLPMVGVCFGHQMIAHALGGRTVKSDRGWAIGVHTFDVSLHQPWMQPPRKRFSLLMSCQDQVQLLPPGAQVLASSPHCPVALYQAGTLLGIQGHPEWTPEYADALLEIRRERIGPALVDAARKTLSQALDNALLARWIRHWLAANR
jgi:GMP synthase-like glutamine amidotransferase